VVDRLISSSVPLLKAGGHLILEIGSDQEAPVRSLIAARPELELGPDDPRLGESPAGHPRHPEAGRPCPVRHSFADHRWRGISGSLSARERGGETGPRAYRSARGEGAGRSALLALTLLLGCDWPPTGRRAGMVAEGALRRDRRAGDRPGREDVASRSSGEVKVWDLAARKELRPFPTDGSEFGSLAYSPDGRTLAVNRAGVGAVVWDWPQGMSGPVYRDGTVSRHPPRRSRPTGGAWRILPTGRTLGRGREPRGRGGSRHALGDLDGRSSTRQ